MQSRATITSEIASSFPTNNTKYITAQFLRTFQEIMNSSKLNLVDDNLSDIQFSRPDFQAGNALDAVIELAKLSRPIFYADVKFYSFTTVLIGHNFPGMTLNSASAGARFRLIFPSVTAATGAQIRKDHFMQEVEDTSVVIHFDKANLPSGTVHRFIFYQEYVPTDYLISS